MTIETSIAFAIACFVVMATPGPGVMATIGRGMTHGFWQTQYFVMGIALGDLTYLLSAIFGLAAIATHFEGVFTIIRWIGVAYLIYLGIKAWTAPPVDPRDIKVGSPKPVAGFLGGLFLTLGNPKAIMFYLGFLPAFIDMKNLSGTDIGIVVTIDVVVLVTTMATYAFLSSSARMILRSPRAIKYFNRSAGTVMIGTGAFIAIRN
ncbi:MAG: LysE family translocator [Rhodospirillales bacterium]|jgi:threonine/homoserine/homoserine lactone efflux protein|nr:LysE family translocator [Rhodospirillales bacterium]